ncbi:hypothetical protein EBR57_05030 [bacterium]|nr:hypothetical protein [bacterium]
MMENSSRWAKILAYIVLGASFVAMLGISYRYRSILLMPEITSDEFLFIRTIFKLSNSVATANWVEVFNYTWFNYGFGYFAAVLLTTLPGMLCDQWTWIVMVPRLWSIVPMIIALGAIFSTFSIWRRPWAGLAAVIGILSMPYMWQVGTWFHPDSLMMAWITGVIWAFARDDGRLGSYFWAGVGLFGCAIGTKFQAVLLAPLVVMYWGSYRVAPLKMELVKCLKEGIGILGMVAGIFWIWNPYIVHPMGFKAFKRLLEINTEAGSALVPYVDRLQMGAVIPYGWPVVVGLVFGGTVVGGIVSLINWKDPRSRLVGIVATAVILNTGYLVLFVNKGWAHYYLVPIVFAWIAVADVTARLRKGLAMPVLASLFCWNAVYATSVLRTEFYRRDAILAADRDRLVRNQVTEILKSRLRPGDRIVATQLAIVDFQVIGVSYLDVNADMKSIRRRALVRDAHDDYFKSRGFSIIPEFTPYRWIVVSKRTPYFLPAMARPGEAAFFTDGRRLIDEMGAGKWGYEGVYDSPDLLILRQK